MSAAQRIAITIGSLVLVALGVFPPWVRDQPGENREVVFWWALGFPGSGMMRWPLEPTDPGVVMTEVEFRYQLDPGLLLCCMAVVVALTTAIVVWLTPRSRSAASVFE
jgi:hypothetical protein